MHPKEKQVFEWINQFEIKSFLDTLYIWLLKQNFKLSSLLLRIPCIEKKKEQNQPVG